MSDLNNTKKLEQGREALLLERARQGDAEATRELFETYRPRVRRFLASVTPPQEVDDLVQETMIAGWAGMPKFRGQSSLMTWLTRIANYLRINRARTTARRGTPLSLDAPGSETLVQRAAPEMPLEQGMAGKATSELLYGAIERACSPPQQRVLILAFQGEAFDAIGNLLGMPAATVRSHNRRGRCRLLAYLIEHHLEWLGGPSALQTAWERACQGDPAERPDAEEQDAWARRNPGARAYCGAVLKLARYLQLAVLLMGLLLGGKR